MKIADITGFLEKIAPLELADESDRGRIGLILDRDNEVNKIATALDVTDHVLQEAARAGAIVREICKETGGGPEAGKLQGAFDAGIDSIMERGEG